MTIQTPGPNGAKITLADATEAAEYCRMSAAALTSWTESGHAPHHFVGDEGPYYRKQELAEWVKTNLIHSVEGMPVPRRVNVLIEVNRLDALPPPLSIASLDGLLHLPLTAQCSGVYFLCKGRDVVYVGQSYQVIGRIAAHIAEAVKDFDCDRVYYLPCPRADLDRVERRFIGLLRPKYNAETKRIERQARHAIARTE